MTPTQALNVLRANLTTYTLDGTDFVVVELRADDTPLAEFRYYATDLEELARSLTADGEFFILTCWCGESTCAGIYDGVRVRRAGSRLFWHVPQPPPAQDFVFDAEAVRETLGTLRKQIKRLVAERTYSDKTLYEIVPSQNEPFFTLG